MQPKRFPLTSWQTCHAGLSPEEMVKEWVDIGFTLTMTRTVTNNPETHKETRHLLDLCAEHGIEAMLLDDRICLPGGNWRNPPEVFSLPENYRERAAEAVKEWEKHPAVWGFYVTDEPLCGAFPSIAEAYRVLRDLTDREPYVNYLPNHIIDPECSNKTIREQIGFDDFDKYLDHVVKETKAAMLSSDQYCSMSEEWGGADHYYRCLAHYQAAAIRHDIPFWNIILSHGHWMYKAPTPLQMGWQFYSSLAYGAQGIMYFQYRGGMSWGYGAPIDELGNRGPLFYQLQRQHNQFCKQWEWRYRDCRPIATFHWPKAPANLKSFNGSGIVRTLAEEASVTHFNTPPASVIIGEMRDSLNRPHVLIANASAEKHAFMEIGIKGRAVYYIDSENNERQVKSTLINNNQTQFQDHIMPGQAIFFRVEE